MSATVQFQILWRKRRTQDWLVYGVCGTLDAARIVRDKFRADHPKDQCQIFELATTVTSRQVE